MGRSENGFADALAKQRVGRSLNLMAIHYIIPLVFWFFLGWV